MGISKMIWQHSYVRGNWNDKSTNQTNVSGILRAIEEVFIGGIAWNPMSKLSIFMPLNFKCQIGSAMWSMISGVWANEKHICSIIKEDKDSTFLLLFLVVLNNGTDPDGVSYIKIGITWLFIVQSWFCERQELSRVDRYSTRVQETQGMRVWRWNLLRIPSL